MIPSSLRTISSTQEKCLTRPVYFSLRSLAVYSSCSVRWLRDRLVDHMHPLPHHRVAGKLLVKKDDFDRWMDNHRVIHSSDRLNQIVASVVLQVRPPQRVT